MRTEIIRCVLRLRTQRSLLPGTAYHAVVFCACAHRDHWFQERHATTLYSVQLGVYIVLSTDGVHHCNTFDFIPCVHPLTNVRYQKRWGSRLLPKKSWLMLQKKKTGLFFGGCWLLAIERLATASQKANEAVAFLLDLQQILVTI
ncbi:hypothetical protein chiPu_0014310 [Chiloscyllium punctatum]|uniref:Uncharacterized protein n=1 Tax=Chiloscyllium punctatum TaxID=137246 RepID=A0A401SZK1_CHIPU|nr:hypothetical protein [Chiloscyllium punctatum]